MSGKNRNIPDNKGLKGLLQCAIAMAITLAFLFPSKGIAQCNSFARAISRHELSPYIHDGNLNATILGEGETLILRKTVFSGQKYRLVVKGVADMPPLKFRILYSDQELFDNSKYNYVSKWDFTAEITRTISIEVTAQEDDNPDTHRGGCVAILIGIDPN